MMSTQRSFREPLNTVSEGAAATSRPGTPDSSGSLMLRAEYSPGQTSQAARPQSASLASPTNTMSPARPVSAGGSRPSSAPGRRLVSPASSDGALSPGEMPARLRRDSLLGSPASPASRSGSPHMTTAKLKLHVQAMAANRSKEQLAEDVIALQQSLKSAASRERKLNTERLRLDTELRKAVAEPARSTYDPHTTSRSSSALVAATEKQASLVASLKGTNKQLRAARDELTEELSSLQRSTRVTKAAELEAEARMYLEEMDRQKKLARSYAARVQELEGLLAEAQMEVTAKRASTSKGRDTMARTTNIYNPDGTLASAADSLDNDGAPRSLRQELQMATIQAGRGLTGRSKELRAALASMQSAHRLLVAEAAALRQFLPEGCSWNDLDPKRWKQAGVSPRGASAVLRFLRTHEVRLHNELAGLPGAKRRDKDVKPPRELNGPDYYVLEKDLQKAVKATQRTKQDITRMSEEVRAAEKWKAEAQRLREQMDGHMQDLTHLAGIAEDGSEIGGGDSAPSKAGSFTAATMRDDFDEVPTKQFRGGSFQEEEASDPGDTAWVGSGKVTPRTMPSALPPAAAAAAAELAAEAAAAEAAAAAAAMAAAAESGPNLAPPESEMPDPLEAAADAEEVPASHDMLQATGIEKAPEEVEAPDYEKEEEDEEGMDADEAAFMVATHEVMQDADSVFDDDVGSEDGDVGKEGGMHQSSAAGGEEEVKATSGSIDGGQASVASARSAKPTAYEASEATDLGARSFNGLQSAEIEGLQSTETGEDEALDGGLSGQTAEPLAKSGLSENVSVASAHTAGPQSSVGGVGALPSDKAPSVAASEGGSAAMSGSMADSLPGTEFSGSISADLSLSPSEAMVGEQSAASASGLSVADGRGEPELAADDLYAGEEDVDADDIGSERGEPPFDAASLRSSRRSSPPGSLAASGISPSASQRSLPPAEFTSAPASSRRSSPAGSIAASGLSPSASQRSLPPADAASARASSRRSSPAGSLAASGLSPSASQRSLPPAEAPSARASSRHSSPAGSPSASGLPPSASQRSLPPAEGASSRRSSLAGSIAPSGLSPSASQRSLPLPGDAAASVPVSSRRSSIAASGLSVSDHPSLPKVSTQLPAELPEPQGSANGDASERGDEWMEDSLVDEGSLPDAIPFDDDDLLSDDEDEAEEEDDNDDEEEEGEVGRSNRSRSISNSDAF